MRHHLIGGAIAAAVAVSPAIGADIPARQPVHKAPAAVVAHNWSGWYLGGHVGYGWARPEIDAIGIGPVSGTPRPDGFLAGGQIGVNWQTGALVLGVEADASWGNLDNTSTCTVPGVGTLSCRGAPEWFGTVAARLGYAVDRTLWYVKGGGAWVDEEFTQLGITAPVCVGSPCNGSNFVWGWMVGGGVEHAFAPNWSAKIEYNYLDFSDKDRVTVVNALGATNTFDVGKTMHLVKVGLNYHFNWWGRR
jgi:outer membrane immunogenic protein